MRKLLNYLLGEDTVSEQSDIEEAYKALIVSFVGLAIIFGGLWIATVFEL